MRRFFKRLALVLVVLAIGAVALIWFIGRTAPSWYEPPDASDEAVALLADRVEYGVVEQAQKARPTDEPWAVRLGQEQVNAWLSARLRAWIAHEQEVQWPEHIGTPQVHLQPEQASLALPLGGKVVVAELRPTVDDGWLRLELVGLRLGRLALPGDPVESLLGMIKSVADRDGGDEAAWTRTVDILTGREPIEPVLDLADGRRVRLIDLRCRDAAIDLTCRTLAARPTEPTAGETRDSHRFPLDDESTREKSPQGNR